MEEMDKEMRGIDVRILLVELLCDLSFPSTIQYQQLAPFLYHQEYLLMSITMMDTIHSSNFISLALRTTAFTTFTTVSTCSISISTSKILMYISRSTMLEPSTIADHGLLSRRYHKEKGESKDESCHLIKVLITISNSMTWKNLFTSTQCNIRPRFTSTRLLSNYLSNIQ